MPLLAQDKFGRVYQTEGLSEFDDASVGYYAEMDDTDNLYFGEMGSSEQRRLAALRKFRKKQAKLRQIQAQKKAAQLRKLQAQKAAQDRVMKARIAKAQEKVRRKQTAMKIARIKGSRNAFAGYEQSTVGNPLEGWQNGEAIMSPSDWKNAGVSGVGNAEDFGIANYHQVSHPLMGFDYGYYDDMDGMGFKKFKIKIKAPKIKIKLPKLSQVIGKQADKALNKLTKEIGKGAGAIYQAPLKLTKEIMTKVPIVRDVYKGVDKLTGGTLTSLHRTVMLPGEALKGKPITKAMFMESLVNVIKVGAIVVSGGAAASVVGAASGALAQGPLGKTSFGKTILSIGEIASLSSLGKMGLQKALEKKAVDMASAHAASEAGKRAGVLGSIVASAAVSAGASGAGVGTTTPNATPKADANSVKQAAQAANTASQVAAQKAAEAVKTGGLKFDSAVAQKQFIEQAQTQAKKQVAREFQKKTGIPLDVAAQVAQGKIPSPSELREKVKNEFYGKVSDLENRIAQIPSQISNAEPLMKKTLEMKGQLLAKELADRKALVAKVQSEAGEKLAAANRDLKEKGLAAAAKQTVVAELGKKHDELSQKIKNSNLDERARMTIELDALQKQLMKERADYDRLVADAEEAARKAEYEKERGAVETLQAEFGGPGAKERYLSDGAEDYYIHPMLRYNLVQRKA